VNRLCKGREGEGKEATVPGSKRESTVSKKVNIVQILQFLVV